MYRGEQVRIEFSSLDATTAAALSLFDSEGVARPLAANERLIIHNLVVSPNNTATFYIFDDKNGNGTVDAGERLFSKSSASTSVVPVLYGNEGLPCGKGRVPKVIAATAIQVEVTGIGSIVLG